MQIISLIGALFEILGIETLHDSMNSFLLLHFIIFIVNYFLILKLESYFKKKFNFFYKTIITFIFYILFNIFIGRHLLTLLKNLLNHN